MKYWKHRIKRKKNYVEEAKYAIIDNIFDKENIKKMKFNENFF
jgi:hypothetical protein